jgi:hypothetical protein
LITSKKSKIGKGYSYALSTSMVANEFEAGAVSIRTEISYSSLRNSGVVLRAFYWMPNPRVSCRRIYIQAGCVVSTDRSHASKKLQRDVMPRFVNWVQALNALDDRSPVLYDEPLFVARYESGEISISEHPRAN